MVYNDTYSGMNALSSSRIRIWKVLHYSINCL